jgi:hypothetical protein
MSAALGGVEKEIVKLSNNYNIPVDKLISNFSYTNDLKVECVKLMNAKNARLSHEKIMNCASKFDYASRILDEINSKINN